METDYLVRFNFQKDPRELGRSLLDYCERVPKNSAAFLHGSYFCIFAAKPEVQSAVLIVYLLFTLFFIAIVYSLELFPTWNVHVYRLCLLCLTIVQFLVMETIP